MKKALLSILFIATTKGYAQSEPGFGIKGGLNYSANGDVTDSAGDALEHPDRNIGYHIGVFGRVGEKLYFRPELVYTSISSSYDDDDFKMQKLDAPLLVGLKVIGPLSVFGGPSLQYILDTDFDGVTLGDVKNDFSVGLNFGVAVALGSLGLDLRYERGFSDNEAEFLGTNGLSYERIDTRPDQFILSLSLNL
ncbi:MAG: outer membrane beta-barrel protein [Leeuwenhoekiella sp.]